MLLASSLEMIVIGQQMSYKKKKKKTQATVLCFSLGGGLQFCQSQKRNKRTDVSNTDSLLPAM